MSSSAVCGDAVQMCVSYLCLCPVRAGDCFPEALFAADCAHD